MRVWHTDKRDTMQWKTLHDIDTNLTFTHFSSRDIFDAWYRSEDILGRAKVCTYWLKMRVLHIDKWETMQWKDLHDIDTNLTFTHFSRRDFFDAWHRSEDILERAKVCTYWLKMRVCDTDKRETMQWKKTIWYRHESHVHALFTWRYFFKHGPGARTF